MIGTNPTRPRKVATAMDNDSPAERFLKLILSISKFVDSSNTPASMSVNGVIEDGL